MSEPQFKAEYTSGNIGKTMLKAALAMLPATLAMSGYNITDTFFIGRLGSAIPLAAMGYTFPVIMLVGCIFHGLTTGTMANLAHALGRKDGRQATALVNSGILLLSLLAVLLAILGILFADHIFVRLGAHGETLEQVRAYMDIWFAGCITAAIGNGGNKIMIAAGEPKISSAMTVMGMLINLILDPLMIFGLCGFPAMGIRGAAIATVISQAVSATVILILLKRRGLLNLRLVTWNGTTRCWRLIFKYGLPAILGMLLIPIANTIITKITAQFGDVAVAGVAAASRLEMVAFVFPMALGTTLMPMIGQNFGAGLYQRVRDCLRFSMTFAFIFLSCAGALFIIFAPNLVVLFTPEESVREIMISYMRIIPLGFGMVECMRFAGFALTACGHPQKDAWLKALRVLGMHIPLSLLALYLQNLNGVFWARLLSDVFGGLITIAAAKNMLRKLPQEDSPATPAE